jgi:hypothetical protein
MMTSWLSVGTVELRGLWLLDSCGHNKAGICERRSFTVNNKKAFEKLVKKTEEDRRRIALWKVRALFYSSMLEINFERIHKAMVALDWKWGMPGKIPTVEELKSEVYGRLDAVGNAAMDGKYHRSSCGGFVVEYDNKEETVSIIFELTSCTTFEEGGDSESHPFIAYV